MFDDGSYGLPGRLRRVILAVARPRLLARQFFRCLKGTVSRGYEVRPAGGSPFKASVQYRRGIDLERLNDLFWFPDSGIKPEDILVSFDSTLYPVNEEELERLRNYGFGYVAHSTEMFPPGSIPMRRQTSRLDSLELRRFWFSLRTGWMSWLTQETFWQWSRLVELMARVNELREYYEAENVRVDIGLDSGKTRTTRAIAMDHVSGVKIGVQWSSFERKTSFHSKSDQVFFCWGEDQRHAIQQARSSADHVLLTGYIYDQYVDGQRPKALQLRRDLVSMGAEFVVAFFDDRPTELHYPRSVSEDLYQRLLRECLAGC